MGGALRKSSLLASLSPTCCLAAEQRRALAMPQWHSRIPAQGRSHVGKGSPKVRSHPETRRAGLALSPCYVHPPAQGTSEAGPG